MIVGVISDTHGLLRPEALEALSGVDYLLHAGDIGDGGIVAALSGIAPLTSIRGNVDKGDWANALPEQVVIDLAGHRILMLHDRKALHAADLASGVGIVVSGHSHRPSVQREGGVLYLNPGSAGPRRFGLPVALALLNLGAADPTAHIVDLL